MKARSKSTVADRAADGGEGDRDQLFDLYLARVAKAETVQTVRRDVRLIFRDALNEAKVALEVYREMVKGVNDHE